MTMSPTKQRNFLAWMVEILKDMYVGATSVIEPKGNWPEPIGGERGVKQGCPFSRLFFNPCIEPPFKRIESWNQRTGAVVQLGEGRIEFATQEYADDVVFVSQRRPGIEDVLRTSEDLDDGRGWKGMWPSVPHRRT
jgi:hypothetical protein